MIQYTRVNAFGWVGSYAVAPAGSVLRVSTPRDLQPEQKDYATVWTKGRMEFEGRVIVAGDVSQRTPALPTGDHDLVAVEDTEWWCFTADKNGGALPRLDAISAAPGAAVTAVQGDLLLVASPGFGHPVGTAISISSPAVQLMNAGDAPAWLLQFAARKPI